MLSLLVSINVPHTTHITQSQNVPLSCLSRSLANRLAEAAYRDILGLSNVRAFSADWNTADCGFFRLTAPAAMLGHLGAISLKNLTKHKEVRNLGKELIRLFG